MKNEKELTELAKHSKHNEIEIIKSKTCSCYFCRQSYSARDVNDWVNDKDGVTAICPICGMDAVIGDACGIPFGKADLKELNLAYYGDDYMGKHPAAALKYVERYKRGAITHKRVNENLYIQYLSLLAGRGNSQAAYDLGELYENGSEFTPADPKAAFSYFAMKCLSSDGGALTRLGTLSESGALGKEDPKGAYECYAKGMAMGSMDALVHFADCYIRGVFVEKNQEFAFDVLSSVWPDCYARFVASGGKEINVFPDVAFRLGVFFLYGTPFGKDSRVALRYFLYAKFGFELMKSAGLATAESESALGEVTKKIADLAKKFGLKRQDPVFDNDTFDDTIGEVASSPSFLTLQGGAISGVDFDKETHECSFDIAARVPALVVDAGNLFCGFVPGSIHWDFVDVSDVRVGNGAVFGKIGGNSTDGWDFIVDEGGNERPVLSLVFFRGPIKRKQLKDGGGEA
ncbi:MAG: sel1 repeat family protein [Bacilli bacterium]|jgi:TPR repeat protein|nr:sel1 repeat family protein [Bacilli bacterium]